jgi:hypothetical protein
MKTKQELADSILDRHADDLSKQLQQEEKFKDEHGLTSEGTILWYTLKLSCKLNWDGNYCIPAEGNLEKKTTILREAINHISYDNKEMYEPTDYLVIFDRLTLSINRLNADMGLPPFQYLDIEQTKKQSSGVSCMLWITDEEKMKLLATQLEKNDYIEKAHEWLEHFSTNTQKKVESAPIQWLQSKYELQHLLRKLNATGHIQYPTKYQPHFLVKGKPLDGLGGGIHYDHKLKKITDIINIIN